jgi:hypothetical protein
MNSLLLLLSLSLGPARSDTIPLAFAAFGREHEDLLTKFDMQLRLAVTPAARVSDRNAFVAFLRSTLIPHAQLEELVLYPALDSVLGTHGYATATMVLDHRAIARLTLELAMLPDSAGAAFQRQAWALAALVDQHFANEETFVLPNLARHMNDRALGALMSRMAGQRLTP